MSSVRHATSRARTRGANALSRASLCATPQWGPLGREIEFVSHNPHYAVRMAGVGETEVIGRVVWLSRALL